MPAIGSVQEPMVSLGVPFINSPVYNSLDERAAEWVGLGGLHWPGRNRSGHG